MGSLPADGALALAVAAPEDVPDLVALHRAVLDEGEWFITTAREFVGAFDSKMRQVRDFARAPNSLFLVARRGQRLCGFLTLHGGQLERMRHVAHLEMMVHLEFRGHGVGAALLDRALAWAMANPELAKISLSVFADNQRAITLYRKAGFREEGRRSREYRLADGTWRDDLLMYRFVDGDSITSP